MYSTLIDGILSGNAVGDFQNGRNSEYTLIRPVGHLPPLRSCSFDAVGEKTYALVESRVGPASECERRPTNRSPAHGGPARLSCRLSHPTSNIIKKRLINGHFKSCTISRGRRDFGQAAETNMVNPSRYCHRAPQSLSSDVVPSPHFRIRKTRDRNCPVFDPSLQCCEQLQRVRLPVSKNCIRIGVLLI
jgi:hypothetical protein